MKSYIGTSLSVILDETQAILAKQTTAAPVKVTTYSGGSLPIKQEAIFVLTFKVNNLVCNLTVI